MLIYVDGSWFKDQCKARWSFAVFKNNKPVHVESGGIYGRLLSNVDGELEAAKRAVEYALKRRAKLLVLCYDYAGIEEFALGRWKPRNETAIRYVETVRKARSAGLEIVFKKVDKRDRRNLLVDALARNDVRRAKQLFRLVSRA